ncbi:MAG: Asp-tRNA(Asn)/Glu-tRNA(Gln) amidotransferase subunit GatC [Archangiaceae bacterium]|nr:Asp-tRNA(Asn)/Glu-tRNA(Gln) amidotransferase subunit GatC [Archangiaceae bacterium]
MKLTLEQVRHVAALARLSLQPDEVEQHRVALQAVLDAFASIDALDLAGVEPTSQVNMTESPLRKDVPVEPLGVKRALANAPDPVGSSFGVPKVIE